MTLVSVTREQGDEILARAGFLVEPKGGQQPTTWPVLRSEALHGLAGQVVETIRPHTEASDAALLMTFLPSFGALVGSGPHVRADGADHPARLSVVLAGQTSRGRKGTASANTRRVIGAADPVFVAEREIGGLGSGEALIQAVADREDGPTDRRALVYEPEMARVFAVAQREGSTLSSILRDAWDRGSLRVTTRKDALRVDGAHICFVGHVTVEELRRNLGATEAANGFGNRFLFVLTARARRLPSGGNLDESDVYALGMRVRAAAEAARTFGRMHRSPEAEALWSDWYMRVDDEVDGLFGAVVARAEAQALRLSVTYALLDGSKVIDVPHLEAAFATWDYAEASAAYIFGRTLGDPTADRLLEAIEDAEDGLEFEAQHAVFGRHARAAEITRARRVLEDRGLIVTASEATSGRARSVSRIAKKAKDAKEAPSGDLTAPNSLTSHSDGEVGS